MRQYNDSDDSSTQSTETPALTWVDACLLLIRTPNIDSFKSILADQKMTAQRAFLWVFIGGIFFGLALSPTYPLSEMIGTLILGIPGTESAANAYQPNWLTIVLMAIVVGGMYSVIGFIIQTWLLQRVGEIFKASGKYEHMFVLRGVYYPVLLALRALIVAAFGASSPATMTLIVGTLLLDLLLSSMAMSAANNITWRQGLLMVAGMNAGLFIGLIIIASFSLMGR